MIFIAHKKLKLVTDETLWFYYQIDFKTTQRTSKPRFHFYIPIGILFIILFDH